MSLSVVKFGGSSFRRLEDYRSVCDVIVRRLREQPGRLVVVVSAMYGHTDRLLAAARFLSPNLSGEASDSLLTTGEFISASLLKIALDAYGVRSAALNAYRLGILSDSTFAQATVRSVDTKTLQRTLQEVDVAVVTGAQAVDEEGRITMLGRNSSDLTAVVLAGALGLDECEIYSDVAGVYSADPHVFPNARLLPRVPHSQVITMSRCGAKVIHFGAAECAQRSRVQIICRDTALPEKIGTVVAREGDSVPAIVLNEKASFFEFDSLADLAMVEAQLSVWGVASASVDLKAAPVLAVTQGVLSVNDFLRGKGIPFRQLVNQGMVTIIHGSGKVEKILADSGVVRTLASQHHDRLYGHPLPSSHLRAAAVGEVAARAAGFMAMSASAGLEPDLLP